MRVLEFQTIVRPPASAWRALRQRRWPTRLHPRRLACDATNAHSLHHGVSPARFPLYLYEWQFRYNHRRENLFDLFLNQSLQLLPDL